MTCVQHQPDSTIKRFCIYNKEPDKYLFHFYWWTQGGEKALETAMTCCDLSMY